MSDQFLAEIRVFAGNFAPTGWAECNGQLLPINQNTALFSLLGTTYGGDGKSTFALPNLQAAFPLGAGQGPGLSPWDLGTAGGAASVTLTVGEMPAHTHAAMAATAVGTAAAPGGSTWAEAGAGRGERMYAPVGGGTVAMASGALGVAGGGLPHNNVQPYLALTFIIALQGLYPPRS